VLDEPAVEFASALLRRRRRKLVRAVERLEPLSAKQRHAVRIAAKKLRYSTEAFGSLFAGDAFRRYRKALMRLQDVLGELNDCAVAADLIEELAGELPSAALAAWLAQRIASKLPELEAASQGLVLAEPFWPPPRKAERP
jgi:CHAD domain-containing protein